MVEAHSQVLMQIQIPMLPRDGPDRAETFGWAVIVEPLVIRRRVRREVAYFEHRHCGEWVSFNRDGVLRSARRL